MPRILKEPEGCEFSIFRYTVVPARLDMPTLSSRGVFRWKGFAMVPRRFHEREGRTVVAAGTTGSRFGDQQVIQNEKQQMLYIDHTVRMTHIKW